MRMIDSSSATTTLALTRTAYVREHRPGRM
jgi:hypothetical protein